MFFSNVWRAFSSSVAPTAKSVRDKKKKFKRAAWINTTRPSSTQKDTKEKMRTLRVISLKMLSKSRPHGCQIELYSSIRLDGLGK
jgi:hypothetical protein